MEKRNTLVIILILAPSVATIDDYASHGQLWNDLSKAYNPEVFPPHVVTVYMGISLLNVQDLVSTTSFHVENYESSFHAIWPSTVVSRT